MIRTSVYLIVVIFLFVAVYIAEKIGKRNVSMIVFVVYLLAGGYYVIGSRLTIQPIDVLKKIVAHFMNLSGKNAEDWSSVEDWINKSAELVQDVKSPLYAVPTIVLNLILFIPFGFLAPVIFSRMNKSYTIILSAVISLTIETIQLIFGLGTFDIKDVVCNVMGTMVGVFVLCPIIIKHTENL